MPITCYMVFLQITLLHEWHITQTSIKWMLSSVCALMCLQITLLCEQLIKHITGKRMLSTECVGVPSDYPVLCVMSFRLPWCVKDLLHTSQVNECSPLYVLVCLQITLLCEQLITHVTSKWMLSTVCVCWCPSDYPDAWRTYYTHHR
jgi:cobalamin synthase